MSQTTVRQCPRCGHEAPIDTELPGRCVIGICEPEPDETTPTPDPVEIPPHPARWSESVLLEIAQVVTDEAEMLGRPVRVLDPFAGPGFGQLVEALGAEASIVAGVELEPEWAAAHEGVIVGDATALPDHWTGLFDMVVTSPCYGNRMADHHEARDDSARVTYRHKLGRMPSRGSSAVMQWGPTYREFHSRAWMEARRVLRPGRLGGPKGEPPRIPGGVAVVNVSNHYRTRTVAGDRRQEEQPVVEWHANDFMVAGCLLEQVIKVQTPRMGFGENGDARVDGERVLVMRLPGSRDGSLW